MNTLSEAEIRSMADTFTEGYRIGFIKAGKPLDKFTKVKHEKRMISLSDVFSEEEIEWAMDEMGYNPYEGAYDYDC